MRALELLKYMSLALETVLKENLRLLKDICGNFINIKR